MHYNRSGSIGEGSAAMATHGSQRHHGSAGSSPDFVGGGYESTEYTDSPPDTSRGQTGSSGYTPHSYGNTPPSLEASYAGAPVASGGSYHHSYTGASGDAYGHSAAHDHTYHSGGASAGYGYHETSHTKVETYSLSPPNNDYSSQGPRGYSTTTPTNWRSNTYPFGTTSRPRHSNSPPLSPLDTRSASYFPPSTRDYPVSAIPPGPSSPTTPSSVSDSPSTPFSPHYSSPPYHGHSHSHSSSASAPYVHGTPLPPLQLSGPGVAGGHFVPPVGSEHPVPVSAYSASPTHAANPYVRYSPPERSQTAPQSQQATQYAGGSTARPFLCDDCGMNFARTHDLKRHQTTHVAGVKKTHPCPYCGKNLSRRDAIKRHVVSKQCPVATEKGYGWPPPEGHVPPLPDTAIDRTSHKRGENPYPVVSVSPERSNSGGPYGYSNGTPSPGPYSPSGYGYSASGPGGYDHGAPGMGPGPQTAVVFEYDHRSSGYKGR